MLRQYIYLPYTVQPLSLNSTPERTATNVSCMKLIDLVEIDKDVCANLLASIRSGVLLVSSQTTKKSVIPCPDLIPSKNPSISEEKFDLVNAVLNWNNWSLASLSNDLLAVDEKSSDVDSVKRTWFQKEFCHRIELYLGWETYDWVVPNSVEFVPFLLCRIVKLKRIALLIVPRWNPSR